MVSLGNDDFPINGVISTVIIYPLSRNIAANRWWYL